MTRGGRIGILVGLNLSNNMKATLYNLGRLVGERYRLDLILGDQEVPERLQGLYNLYRGERLGPIDPAGVFSAWRICSDYLKGDEPDLLLNPCKPQTLGLVVARLGESHDIPSIVRMTGETFRQTGLKSDLYGKAKMWLLHEKMAGQAYSKADRILAVGPSLRDSLISKGYERSKISVLPQPFDPAPFRSVKEKNNLKEELGLEADKKIALFVGRISWYKGGDRLLQIVEKVTGADGQYQFCLVGAGEYEGRFEQFDERSVKLVGEVPHETISSYYGAADVLVFPSRTEGLPNVVLEALAAKLPVVASPVGEIANYVSNIAGSIDEYVDYILEEKWKTDGLPSEFNWENQKRSYLNLFADMLEDKR